MSLEGKIENVIASVVIIAIAVVVRLSVGRILRRREWMSVEDSRRLLIQVRNFTVLLVFFGLIVVWAQELRTAALSLVAFAVAAVIATKEMIMAIGGSFTRATSGSFTIGDRVRIGDYRGDVIDHSLLTTTLLEIGPGHVRTGRALVLPNSMLLSAAVANETRGHDYILHSFSVPVPRRDWRRAERVMLDTARRQSAEYVEEARMQMEQRARTHSLSVPIVDPFVLAKPTSVDAVELTVRVPVPAREVWRIENEIIRSWLDAADADVDPEPNEAASEAR
jgi:small-conductance mechanosensitive channel